MRMRESTTVLLSLIPAAVLTFCWMGASFHREVAAAGPATETSIPTFSTDNIGRQGHFFVGGHYEGKPGNHVMVGALYVETWVPKKMRHPYPVVFMLNSAGLDDYELKQTPDGRPGWAYDFVNQGYTIYMFNHPAAVSGTVTPPRTGELVEEVWAGQMPKQSPIELWPQWSKQTQFPGEGPNKGKMGDPAFDYFMKTMVGGVTGQGRDNNKTLVEDVTDLTDMIGRPIILLIHSGAAPNGWLIADARPKSIKAILAPEPFAPPVENAERGVTHGPGRLWGLTDSFIHYDPPITDPAELHPVQQEKADGPGLLRCWAQSEPAHKLMNLENIPVLQLVGEGSYHRPYSHCTVKWLQQAGVKTDFVKLEEVGLPGNGHQMMAEKNSAGISKFMMEWLDKNVH